MLKIDRENRTLEPTLGLNLIQAGLRERGDIQELIQRNSKAFFDEIGLENAVLLGSEVRPAETLVQDRIDLLALDDDDGTAIIIELKRGANKLHLLQGITYAAMISKWPLDQFRKLLPEAKKVNGKQRIVLVADEFEYEVLTTAEWLVEKYDLDILCVRLEIARDTATKSEFLVCERVYPPLEIEDHARKRRRDGSLTPRNAVEVLQTSTNPAVSAFFEDQRTKVPLNRGQALGRVDEFDQAQTRGETDDGSEVSGCLLAA